MSWEMDCKNYDECGNCGYFKKENARLMSQLEQLEYFKMCADEFSNQCKVFQEENARLRNEIELLKKEWVGL